MILDATKIVPTKIYNLKLSLPKKVKLSNLWLDYFRFTEIYMKMVSDKIEISLDDFAKSLATGSKKRKAL